MKNQVVKIVLAVIVGEITLILLTTLAQEVLFDGISYRSSSSFDIIFGGLATFLAAVLTGVIMKIINQNNSLVPIMAVSIIITLEMIWLISSNLTGDPIWFDILAGISLIVGITTGYLGTGKTSLIKTHEPSNPDS